MARKVEMTGVSCCCGALALLLVVAAAGAGCGGIAGAAAAGKEGNGEADVAMERGETGLEFSVTRVFEAPVEEVWRAWVEPELVMRWWGPRGFTSPMAKMDVRVGGVSLVCMRAPEEFGGRDWYNTWTYRVVEPMERLEFVGRFADRNGNDLDPGAMGLPPGIPRETPQVVTFRAAGEGRTEMTVTEYGYGSEQAVALSKGGLEQCLDKMGEIFSAP